MNDVGNGEALTGLGRLARLEPVGIDDWADVRQVHRLAFERLAGPFFETEELAAFRTLVASPEYTDDLMGESLYGAWIERDLVGTAGWRPIDDTGSAARITSVFVNPLFARLGIGRRLVCDAEHRARQAGFASFATRATPNAVGFFEALGYDVSSHGVCLLGPGLDIPVTFLRRGPVAGHASATGGLGGSADCDAASPGLLVTPRDR